MKVSLKLFAALSRHLPPEAQRSSQVELDISPDTTVQGLIDQRAIPRDLCSLVLVNGGFVPEGDRAEHRLREGDVVSIWPPVAGG